MFLNEWMFSFVVFVCVFLYLLGVFSLFFQDIFWYYFLEKFQSSRNSQMKLFNRVAHNYVQLMIYAKDPDYRETFFKVQSDVF